MKRLLRLWFLTLLVYGGVAALLIFVAVPQGYNSGVLWPRPGWTVRNYQHRAIPLAAAGYLFLATVLSIASRRETKRQLPAGRSSTPSPRPRSTAGR